ncbi:MAG: hypothetical protein JSW27_12835 [Phycisphaerales bacterium]|nr:MAG: hypothetical protein JSW27_12835 [Phycisphaerales bacterium]
MSRMALVAFVVTLTMNAAHAGLCDLTPDGSAGRRAIDFPSNWHGCYLDRFLSAAAERPTPFWGPPNGWDVSPPRSRIGGDHIDRWWYVYLDRGRYRFLDETQYTLLDGSAGLWWRWRYRAWLDAVNLSWSVPARSGRDAQQVIPEPAGVVLLALGALGALRLPGARPAARIRSAAMSTGCR